MLMGTISVHEELRASIENFLHDHRSWALDDVEWCQQHADLPLSERGRVVGCGCEGCTTAGRLRDLV